MTWIVEWLPWIPPALLSGIINLFVAYQKLYRDCRSPLFNPWRSFGVWWWVIVQLALPILVFWFHAKIPDKPAINFSLYWTAISLGFVFTLFVNANADLGFINFSIDKYYAFFNEFAYQSIGAGQAAQLANFKQDLRKVLKDNTQNLDNSLDWIKDYFSEDVSLKNNPIEQRELLQEVEQAKAKNTTEEKVAAVIALVMKIRRKDCKQMLNRFTNNETFLKKYF